METAKRNAKSINWPTSVVEFLQGHLGHPIGGFPEPFASDVLGDLPRIQGRPGGSMPDFDFAGLHAQLAADHPTLAISEGDLSSAAQYPGVFRDFATIKAKYGDLAVLPTRQFLEPMKVGEGCVVPSQEGAEMLVTYMGLGDFNAATGEVEVRFEVNGKPRSSFVAPKNPAQYQNKAPAVVAAVAEETGGGEKADPTKPGHVGAPMPGAVLAVHVGAGDNVKSGDKVAVLTAMKMETNVTARIDGKVARVLVGEGDEVAVGDLLMEVDARAH